MGPKNNLVVPTETDLRADVQLAARARQVLRQNTMGDWTRAAPNLYPHQWSWDSAFIAIGPAHFNTRRALKELLALFGHQWRRPARFPTWSSIRKPRRGATSRGHSIWHAPRPPRCPPAPPYTRCLCQPPVHAIAALRVWEVAERKGERADQARDFLREIYPKLPLWHRYLMTHRDPEGFGLVTSYYPWESGPDNSPAGTWL
jgi:hypothetical protein